MRDMVHVRGGHPNRYRAPDIKIGRSQIDRSHNHKTTFDADRLIPYFVDEILPGDTVVLKLDSFIRIFSPLDAPIMDNIEVTIDFFFTPTRLVWSNWKYFLGAHDEAGAQDTTYTIPKLSSATVVESMSLANYMGFPIGCDFTVNDYNALPFRCYRLIYNEWYRDENLIDEIGISFGDGPDGYDYGDASPTEVRKSAKKHDYFTSALPYLQKGTASTAALAGSVDVETLAQTTENISVYGRDASILEYRLLDAGAAQVDIGVTADADGSEKLYVNLATAGTVDINALRTAAAVQRLLERDARGGTRYPEQIRAHFGVEVPDFTAQRPEYIGGGRGFVHVTPVANTVDQDSTVAAGGADVYQGELRGIGHGRLSCGFSQSFVEHGYLLGILRARGDVSYSQGVDRMWRREDRYDFYWPEFAMLGEQGILNSEIFLSNVAATDDTVWGYQERYAEYRFKKSLVTGKFASDAPGSLDFWHLSEDFASLPGLNQTFIESNTPMSRITTVDSEPDFEIDGRFDYKCARPMPVRPLPTLMPARF